VKRGFDPALPERGREAKVLFSVAAQKRTSGSAAPTPKADGQLSTISGPGLSARLTIDTQRGQAGQHIKSP
jgi:hypothetical protein